MFAPSARGKVNLADLPIQGIRFSPSVLERIGGLQEQRPESDRLGNPEATRAILLGD